MSSVQPFSQSSFLAECDEVCDELVPLAMAIKATGLNAARHVELATLALMDLVTPEERQTLMKYLHSRLLEKLN